MRTTKASKKGKLLAATLSDLSASRLCYFIALTIVCLTSAITRKWWFLIGFPVAFVVVDWQRLLFELLVAIHVIQSQFNLFPWYSVVDDNLLLGAIPLESRQLSQELAKLNVKAVVSVVQPWELKATTIFGRPLDEEHWKRMGIQHFLLPTTDFTPPSFAALDEGGRILNKFLSNNERVYVHCKSGIGRSASVILAYFVRYKHEDLQSAYEHLKSRRRVVFKETSAHMKQLRNYTNKIQQKSN